MAYVEIRSATKSFGEATVLHDVDLEIEERELCVFVGPSGCGKTTLLRLIAGLEELEDGEIHIGGERIDRLPPSRRGIAMVFQNYALYPHMSVFENMSFGLRLARADKAFIRERVGEAADILQISELLERRPRELSGGQRQRVAIGRAIVREPKVFLFDEPLSNLDARLRVRMRVELARLHQRLKATMIHVTHDQVEAMTMANRIVVLNGGRVEQIGRPLELYQAPRNRFVAGFIGSPAMNFLDGRIAGLRHRRVDVDLGGGGRVAVCCIPRAGAVEGAPVTLGVRPEALAPDGEGDSTIAGKVSTVERLGGETCIYLGTAEGHELTVHVPGDRMVAPGDRIAIGLSADRCHLFDANGEAFERPVP